MTSQRSSCDSGTCTVFGEVLQLFPSEQRNQLSNNRRKQLNWFQLQPMEIRSIAFQEELLIPLMHLIFLSTIFIMVSWSAMSSRNEVMITNLSYKQESPDAYRDFPVINIFRFKLCF